MRKPIKITTSLDFDGSNHYITVHRGLWASMKVRLDETHDLANALVDLTEKVTADE